MEEKEEFVPEIYDYPDDGCYRYMQGKPITKENYMNMIYDFLEKRHELTGRDYWGFYADDLLNCAPYDDPAAKRGTKFRRFLLDMDNIAEEYDEFTIKDFKEWDQKFINILKEYGYLDKDYK